MFIGRLHAIVLLAQFLFFQTVLCTLAISVLAQKPIQNNENHFSIHTSKVIVKGEAFLPTVPSQRELLAVSPYIEPEHQLNLTTVDLSGRILAIALTDLAPSTDEYAITDYSEAFNWSFVMKNLKHLAEENNYKWTNRDFYVVEFRSKLNSNVNRTRLFQLDKESHREATESGGLLMYWYGTPNQEHRNLATCVWRSKEDAAKGGKGPWHQQARKATREMYEQISVHGLGLNIADDVDSWSFSDYRQ